jgi:hypothetical protein
MGLLSSWNFKKFQAYFYFTHFYLHPRACVPHLRSNLLHTGKLFITPHTGSAYSGPYSDHYTSFTTVIGIELSELCIPVPIVSLSVRRKDHFPRLIIVLSMRMSTNPSVPRLTRRWSSCCFPRDLFGLQGRGVDVLLACSRDRFARIILFTI